MEMWKCENVGVSFISTFSHCHISTFFWPRRTMDSIRVSEAPDTGSIPVEATNYFIPLVTLYF